MCNIKHIVSLLLVFVLIGTMTACQKNEEITVSEDTTVADVTSMEEVEEADAEEEVTLNFDTAVSPIMMNPNDISVNTYLAEAEATMHNDIHGTDVTSLVMPLGIYTEVLESNVPEGETSSPAFFYDENGYALAPYSPVINGTAISGGVAIRDMSDSDNDGEIQAYGSFVPAIDDTSSDFYGILISYSFVDGENYAISPTTNGHIVMLQMLEKYESGEFVLDENGDPVILETFIKSLDVDVVGEAIEVLGDDIDTNLLSLTYDYDGNLWFVTGGFLVDPYYETSSAGFCGYIEREYIDSILNSSEDDMDISDYIHFMKFEGRTDDDGTVVVGENAENGLAAHENGVVILTNMACYLFSAIDESTEIPEDAVLNDDATIMQNWKVQYESDGRKILTDDGTEDGSGAGLAWGGGSSPTLTEDLVLFTDNKETVSLIAVDVNTGEKVIDDVAVLDFGAEVSVENSICVYSPNENLTSVLVCNWLGAGKNDIVDSSVQQFDALYDNDWRAEGSSSLEPGVERIDIIKDEDGNYYAESIWVREDLKSTCMIKLSTATGNYYGYTQDEETGEWGFFVLDYETGETILWIPVSDESDYNNIAVGIMQGNGNTVFCPTDSTTLVRISDRFAYLLNNTDIDLDINEMSRTRQGDDYATYIHTAVVSVTDDVTANDDGTYTLAICVNGLDLTMDSYEVVYIDSEGNAVTLDSSSYEITDKDGTVVPGSYQMSSEEICEIHLFIENNVTGDSMALDTDTSENIKVSIALAIK